MDLSIVKKKLESKSPEGDGYSGPEECVADIRLIFFNCAKYYKVNLTLQGTCLIGRVTFFLLNVCRIITSQSHSSES